MSLSLVEEASHKVGHWDDNLGVEELGSVSLGKVEEDQEDTAEEEVQWKSSEDVVDDGDESGEDGPVDEKRNGFSDVAVLGSLEHCDERERER